MCVNTRTHTQTAVLVRCASGERNLQIQQDAKSKTARSMEKGGARRSDKSVRLAKNSGFVSDGGDTKDKAEEMENYLQ